MFVWRPSIGGEFDLTEAGEAEQCHRRGVPVCTCQEMDLTFNRHLPYLDISDYWLRWRLLLSQPFALELSQLNSTGEGLTQVALKRNRIAGLPQPSHRVMYIACGEKRTLPILVLFHEQFSCNPNLRYINGPIWHNTWWVKRIIFSSSQHWSGVMFRRFPHRNILCVLRLPPPGKLIAFASQYIFVRTRFLSVCIVLLD